MVGTVVLVIPPVRVPQHSLQNREPASLGLDAVHLRLELVRLKGQHSPPPRCADRYDARTAPAGRCDRAAAPGAAGSANSRVSPWNTTTVMGLLSVSMAAPSASSLAFRRERFGCGHHQLTHHSRWAYIRMIDIVGHPRVEKSTIKLDVLVFEGPFAGFAQPAGSGGRLHWSPRRDGQRASHCACNP
jgi:hypothetical protein